MSASQPQPDPEVFDVPASTGGLPGVSYVMPVLNEQDYLDTAIATVLAQEYAGPRELILALGPSSDATDTIAHDRAEADPRIRIVDNPAADIPIGMNKAIAASRYPIIVRMDAHSELPSDYTSSAVASLADNDAVNVGGLMLACGRTPFQAAAAAAYNSRFGLGGTPYHSGGQPGPAESAYLGVFRKDVITAVGGYDETLRRGEDWELNLRIRGAGHTVWFEPRLEVRYFPRDSWGRLVRQFFSTGVWRAELVRRHKGRNPVRFFLPPLLVFDLVVCVLLLPLLLTGTLQALVTSTAWALGSVVALAYLGPVGYLLVLVLVFVTGPGRAAPGCAQADRHRFVLAVTTMHLAWGAGFAVGLVGGSKENRDTSRHL